MITESNSERYCIARELKVESQKEKCLNEVQSSFSIKVDWDADGRHPEGCHGTDWFTADDRAFEISFVLFYDKNLVVSFNNSVILVTREGELKTPVLINSSPEVYRLDPVSSFPKAYEAWDYAVVYKKTLIYALDRDFYDCYKESEKLNREQPNDDEKDIVKYFFEAIRKAFPVEFEERRKRT